jgi:adenosylcobinamide kinase/adenosylcobinamide-phosphate guanylyltransferase
MKTLFIGGIKSGKSSLAELYAIKYAKKKPYYLATCEFFDKEMKKRVKKHKNKRKNSFKTIEESLKLYKKVKKLDDVVLVEDISMWINNMLYHDKKKKIFKEIKKLLKLKQDIIFVQNNVSESVISEYKLTREFVDINGIVSQLIAKECDEVIEVVAGIAKKIK